MINLNKKDSLASKVEEILQQEALKGKQHKIDKNHNNKIDADDFKILRGEKKVAEEIDVKDKTEDTLAGRKKVENKDDVGPNSNFKSSKVRFHAGPDNKDDSETIIPADTNKVAQNKKLKMGEEVEQIEEKEKWIAGAIKKPGALHKQLGVPADKKIPAEKLKSAAEKGGKLGKRANLAMTLKKFKEENEEHSIYDQMIQEVLSKDASAGDWIHDFVHSDNPKFAGKSKEQRKKMALAAYYAKQRNEEVENDICPECKQDPCVCDGNHIEESVEQIDEISKETLTSYRDKAKAHADKLSADFKAGDRSVKRAVTIAKRDRGILKAGNKLHQKQNDEIAKATQGPRKPPESAEAKWKKENPNKPYWGEETESINEELKTKTAYVPYVYTDRHGSGFGGFDVHYSKEKDAHDHVARHGHLDVNGKKGWVEKHEIAKHPSGRWVDANHMRRHGMNEETEQVEEGWDDMMKAVKARSGPQPSGGSGVKQGSRYGGSKQKDKPEHDEKKEVKESKRPETDNVPFEGPYNSTSKPADVVDKSGAHHTPMSRVKHLARQAMKKMKSEMLGKTGTSE